MTWMWMNIPLMVMFFALAVGIPTWLVLQAPGPQADPGRGARDKDPAEPRRCPLPPRRVAGAPRADARTQSGSARFAYERLPGCWG